MSLHNILLGVAGKRIFYSKNSRRLNIAINSHKNIIPIQWNEDQCLGKSWGKDIIVKDYAFQDEENAEFIYFLNWEVTKKTSITFPLDECRPNIFLTAKLSSCFVGIKKDLDSNLIEIIHVNLTNKTEDQAREMMAENSGYYWVCPCIFNVLNQPEDGGAKAIDGHSVLPSENLGYTSYIYGGVGTAASFFGLFEGNGWNFYLQDYEDVFCKDLRLSLIII